MQCIVKHPKSGKLNSSAALNTIVSASSKLQRSQRAQVICAQTIHYRERKSAKFIFQSYELIEIANMSREADRYNEDEVDYRIFACDIIQNVGILLRLPQNALTTAQILLQRVYHATDYTFSKYYLDITAMAALFLAAKIEEYPRRTREVIDVFTHVISLKLKRDIVLSHSQHEKVREELITAERVMLKTLGFNLLSSNPHMILVNYYLAIVRKLDKEQNVWRERDNKRLLQRAWNYLNDSLRLDVFIRYSKEVVACACIQMATEDNGMSFPSSTDGRHWYGLFVNDELEVRETVELIRNLYERERVNPESFRRLIYLTRI